MGLSYSRNRPSSWVCIALTSPLSWMAFLNSMVMVWGLIPGALSAGDSVWAMLAVAAKTIAIAIAVNFVVFMVIWILRFVMDRFDLSFDH